MVRADALDAQGVRRRRELKRHQMGAIALAAAALAVGAVLLPRGDELLLIHVKNRDIARARALLADAPGHGLSSAASVVAHDELYLLEGHVDDALAETEGYASAHPHDAEAWKRLALMYGDAQRLSDQLRATVQIYRLEPTAAVARRLATLYRWTGDESAEAGVLRELVTGGEASTEEALRAARLHAALGHATLARDMLEAARRKEPTAFDYAAMELYASLLLEPDGHEQLAGRIASLPLAREKPEVLVQLARAMVSWGRPEAAVALFDTRPGLAAPPDRLAMRAQVAMGTSEARRVARELAAIDAEHPLAPAPLAAFVQLALSVEDYGATATVLGNSAHRDEPALVGLAIGHAVAHKARQFAQTLIARVGDAGLSDSPLLGLELAVDRGDADGATRWIAQIDASHEATGEQRAALAQYESRLGLKDRAFTRLLGLLVSGTVPSWAANDLAVLAVDIDKVDSALRVLAGSPSARVAWVHLAVTTGRTELIEGWLSSSLLSTRDASALGDAYHLLSDRGNRSLAIIAAQRLFETRGAAGDAVLLGQALMAAGRPAEALVPLRSASHSNADARMTYDAALLGAMRAGAKVQTELRSIFERRLSAENVPRDHRALLVEGLWAVGERASLLDEILSLATQDLDRWLSSLVEAAQAAGQGDRAIALVAAGLSREDRDEAVAQVGGDRVGAQRVDLMQALIELDAPDEILIPQLGKMAYEAGGTWVYVYDERLALRSRTAERAQLWASVGHSSARPTEERRAAASRLLELGATASATEVVQSLAESSAPAGPDLQQLLYLWGPRPNERQLEWLTERLLAAPPIEQPEWMAHLASAGGAERIVAALPLLPDDAPPSFVEAWIDAHRSTSDLHRLRTALGLVLSRSHASTEELRHAAQAALAADLPDLAAQAFGAVVSRQPLDRESLRWLGALAFYEGRTSGARAWLAAYAEAGGDAPEALYQLGELARNEHEPARARQYYSQALVRLDDAAADASNGPLLANVLVRLGERRRATDVFESVLRGHPGLGHVRADYAAALLEWGDYDRARVVLRID